jgi:hypothetical protein
MVRDRGRKNIGNVNKENVVFEDLVKPSKISETVQEDDVERSDCWHGGAGEGVHPSPGFVGPVGTGLQRPKFYYRSAFKGQAARDSLIFSSYLPVHDP